MSLINDALKRARQAHASSPNPNPAPAPAAPMQPAVAPRPVTPPVYFLPFMLFIFCGACWLVIKGWENQPQPGSSGAAETLPVMARESAPDAGAAMPVPENRDFTLESWSGDPAPATPSSAPVPAGFSAETAAPESPRPAASAYKLQGIFYRIANPSAIINSKTVFIGDTVSGAIVKAIDRDSVTLELGGQKQLLTLE